jgi:hypothetical protein
MRDKIETMTAINAAAHVHVVPDDEPDDKQNTEFPDDESREDEQKIDLRCDGWQHKHVFCLIAINSQKACDMQNPLKHLVFTILL